MRRSNVSEEGKRERRGEETVTKERRKRRRSWGIFLLLTRVLRYRERERDWREDMWVGGSRCEADIAALPIADRFRLFHSTVMRPALTSSFFLFVFRPTPSSIIP